MITFALHQAAQIVQGQLHRSQSSDAADRFVGMTQDSRNVRHDTLFAALPGERVDGHQFVDAAARAGAAAALVQRPVDSPLSQIQVSDVAVAMGRLAAAWREGLNVSAVGITGSNGKTTVKNMLAAIVLNHLERNAAPASALLATPGNYNNEIGLPLTLAELSAEHRFAILEMGCAKPGDIAYLAELAKPQVGVVTNASAAHLKGLGSVEGVAGTKGELFVSLAAGNTAIINRDDRFFHFWLNQARPAHVISFGEHEQADVRMAENKRVETPVGDFELHLNLPGKHNQINALAATAAAIALGVELESIVAGLAGAAAEPGRLQPRLQPGGWLLIDDSYNANPASMQAAMRVLADRDGTRWLVIGDMAELADQAEAEHAVIGEMARDLGIHRVFAFGAMAAISASAFGPGGRAFDDMASLIGALKADLSARGSGDLTCLVKGSRSMGMERVVAALDEQGVQPC